jgi:zinc finger BED domain-containing protein 1 (E3 SUMO-protein ligase ZBED1)
MKEYWNVPKLVGMVAAILDPRLKSLKFVNNDATKSQTIRKLRDLYSAEKLASELNPLNDSIGNLQQNTASLSSNSIIAALLDDDDNGNNINDINEVDAYLNLQVSKQRCDPLDWWKDNSKRFPLLSRIARKYLSIPATSVPSERLFSDAGLHITARRNCLSPELVEKLLFLKRNMALFPIFPPNE